MHINIHSLATWIDGIHRVAGIPHNGENWQHKPTVNCDEAEVLRRGLLVADSGASLVHTDQRAIEMCSFVRARAVELGLAEVPHG